tara:strand:+ start:1030 stop:1227 length:198 start_codon:yes stop_codon:yes gene_type:complete
MDDTHDLLTKAYMEYFKENEHFEDRVSYRTHRASRACLRKIRKLAKIRMDEINEKFKTKIETEKN